ncbi:MAG: glycosyltransferase family 4 protein [Herpetosiphonaceae bacterium]|nr:glycosyltransferase family 4 protein [Herpetosiphonaceae bacterium]
MRILHVVQRYYPYVGGSELYFKELSEQFAADGHEVTVLTTDAWDLDHFWARGRRRIDQLQEQHCGVAIRRFPVVRLPGPPLIYPILHRLMVELGRLPGTLLLVRALARLTPRVPALEHYLKTTWEPFDIVATCNITLDFTIVPAAHFARRRGIPHVCVPFVHLGELGNRQIVRYYSQPYQIDLLQQADQVIVQTPSEGRFLAHAGVPATRIREVGCWVKPETLVGGDAQRFRQAHSIQAPIVLSIGTTAYDKGTMHLIEAMEQLWAAGCTAQLVLIASTTLAQFEHYWAQLAPSTQARITLIKAAPHAVKLDALAAANVFALPSRTDSFGIVFLEAWCYDLPVIGARAGGVPDVIQAGRTGLLVPFGAVTELAQAIRILLERPADARRLGAAGHDYVLRELTFPTKYGQFEQIYQRLIKQDKGQA